jgi:Tfp pilus assembly protein PilE
MHDNINKPAPRTGSLLIEAMVALAVIAVLIVVVAQSLVWSIYERSRLASQNAALELAANVLEAARAQPFDELNQSWADAQAVPPEMAELLPAGKVIAKVEPTKGAPHARRLTVEVRWQFDPQAPAQSIQVTGVLSGRETKKAGGTP